MAWPGEAAKESFLEEAKHILKVGKEPDWQRGSREDISDNECAIYKIKNKASWRGQ